METSKSSSNPYVYDKPVTGDKFFGRENEIQQIEKALNETKGGIVILGQHRIGKTSLLFELNNRLDVNQFVTIHFDFLTLGGSPAEIWSGMAKQIARQPMMNPSVSEDKNSQQRIPTPPPTFFDDEGIRFQREFLQEVYNVLPSPSQRLILLIEYFDVVLSSLGFENQRNPVLQALIRISNEERRTVIIFAGMRESGKWEVEFRDLLTQGQVFNLSVLNRESATRLITSLSENIRYGPSAIERIFALTNGHPYFTQLLCSKVFDAARASSTADVLSVPQTLVDSVVPDVLREGETVFERMWESVSSHERPVMSALTELMIKEEPSLIFDRLHSRKQDIPFDQLTTLLKNLVEMQLLEEVRGNFGFLIPLFGLWVKERKPLQQTIEESKAQESAQQKEERNEILVNFALNDRPVGEDKLGYDDYAKAFAQVLANPDTKTPLKRDWG
ncbi:ATP-binding protein [Candidatus Woesearchaeota archaeon]|nr:ATP-binding protein [Candidatus Woesearchaeota archaeon]